MRNKIMRSNLKFGINMINGWLLFRIILSSISKLGKDFNNIVFIKTITILLWQIDKSMNSIENQSINLQISLNNNFISYIKLLKLLLYELIWHRLLHWAINIQIGIVNKLSLKMIKVLMLHIFLRWLLQSNTQSMA